MTIEELHCRDGIYLVYMEKETVVPKVSEDQGKLLGRFRWLWRCAKNTYWTKPLIEYMRMVPAPRCGRKKKHDHAEILVCIVIGFLVGRTSLRAAKNSC